MPRRTNSAAPAQDITINLKQPAAPPADPPEQEQTEKPFFWERLAAIAKDKWENGSMTLWVYRLEPKAVMRTGERGYLAILTQPITPMDVKQRWGGGRFRFMVLENNKMLFSTEEEIVGDPVFDREREVNAVSAAPANGAGTIDTTGLTKILEQQNARLFSVLETLQTKGGDDPAIKSAVEILSTAYKSGLSALTTQTNGSGVDSMKQFETMLTMVERLIGARSQGNSLTETIQLLEKLGLMSKPKSLKEQIEEAKALSDLMGSGADPKDWKAKALELAGQHLPEILDVLKQPRQAPAAPMRPPMRPAPEYAPANSQPAPAPAAAPQAAPVTAAVPQQNVKLSGFNIVQQDAAAAPVDATLPNTVSPAAGSTPPVLTQEEYDYGLKVNVVNMMRQGASGDTIAGFILDCKPEMADDLLKYPEAFITDFFSQDPILKLMVEDPRWLEVLRDAREFLKEEKEATVLQ